jgi:hypothetical protein
MCQTRGLRGSQDFMRFDWSESIRWIWFLLSNEIDVVVEYLGIDLTTRVGQQQRTIYFQIADGKSVVVVRGDERTKKTRSVLLTAHGTKHSTVLKQPKLNST